MPARMVNGVDIVFLHCLKVTSSAQAKPTNRHMPNVVAPGDLRQGLARFAAGQSFTTLMSRKARLPAKLHAPGLGALPPLIGPRQDEVPLEFGEAAKHR